MKRYNELAARAISGVAWAADMDSCGERDEHAAGAAALREWADLVREDDAEAAAYAETLAAEHAAISNADRSVES